MEFEEYDALMEAVNIELERNKELNRKLMVALRGINRICEAVLNENDNNSRKSEKIYSGNGYIRRVAE